jgi:hypothetical protein
MLAWQAGSMTFARVSASMTSLSSLKSGHAA